MKQIDVPADIVVRNLLAASRDIGLCLLDSCNAQHARSNLLIAGSFPVETFGFSSRKPADTLTRIDEITTGDKAAILSLSYDFGRKLQDVKSGYEDLNSCEPDLFVSSFDTLLVHDYSTGITFLTGDERRFDEIIQVISGRSSDSLASNEKSVRVTSNFTKRTYLEAIEMIKEHIRSGNTYQTNLTQQLTVELSPRLSAGEIFERIRRDHPAPFSAFLERQDSTVVSASPESFFKVEGQRICASPIKGTRPRGINEIGDQGLRDELLHSSKDIAENTMIVDLLRNDLGRICEYGSIHVKELCSLQELPTLFHLVSTIEGSLDPGVRSSEIIEALFPCGSITGAPKLRTMQIIDEIENDPRGLSMGAIGIRIPDSGFDLEPGLEFSVAIRTMVIREGIATFNVGGGIVIDSDPEGEYQESLVKARSLLSALGLGDPVKIFG